MQPKVFIIIVNYNGYKDTIECLQSLQKITYKNYEVVVVDNASPNKSVAELKKNLFGAKLIENKENLGFAGGNNTGIKYALENKADYVLLLNNDTIVEPDFLSILIEEGEKNSKAGILGSLICYYDEPNKIWFAGGKINWLLTKGTHIDYNRVIPAEAGIQAHSSKKTDYITGCCLLIKKNVIDKIGMMDDDYFLYYEDTDWNLRAQKAGFESIIVPKSKIYHKISQSTKAESASYIYYHTRNGLMLVKKNGSLLQKTAAYSISIYTFAKQFIKLSIPSKNEWAKAVMKGLYDFYSDKTGKIS